MLVLPPRTLPPAAPQERRHRPTDVSYPRHRNCLVWDFGFTCALCLLHEHDLAPDPDGLTTLTTEHVVAQSAGEGPSSRNRYANLLLACTFCNRARSNTPNQSRAGEQLLDPTCVAWSEHFALHEDRLEPLTDDARYTCVTYDLNDERKVRRRKMRRELVEELLDAMRDVPPLLDELTRRAVETGDRRLLDAARQLRADLKARLRDVLSYKVVPDHAPPTCRCRPHEPEVHRALPGWMLEQVIVI